MDNIVEVGMKINLHIHSQVSSGKDGKKVKNNIKDNIPILVQKLNENRVNICAITDHDNFSYEMYTSLKEAESKNNSIKKVLPGIEFSVRFEHNNNQDVIHIVTIFSDECNVCTQSENPGEPGKTLKRPEFAGSRPDKT